MDTKNQKGNKPQFTGTATRGDIRKAVKSAPNEVHPDKITRTTLKSQKHLKGAFVIAVIAPDDVQEQFTVHHPIGITNCEENDWVMTRSSELHYLAARAQDPKQQQVTTARNERKNKFLVHKQLLEEKDGKLYYPKDYTKTRNEYLAEAELHMKADKRPKGARKPKRSDYLDEDQKEAEERILKALASKESQLFIESETGIQTFRTRGGVLEDQEQIAIKALTGKTPAQAFDITTRLVFKTVGRGEEVKVDVIQRNIPIEDDAEYQRVREELSDANWHWGVAHTHLEACIALLKEVALDKAYTNVEQIKKITQVIQDIEKDRKGDIE